MSIVIYYYSEDCEIGEGMHRGNLCVHIFKPNLPSKDLLSKVRLEGQFTFRSPDREGYRNA